MKPILNKDTGVIEGFGGIKNKDGGSTAKKVSVTKPII